MSMSNQRYAEFAGLIYQYPDKSWSYTPGMTLKLPENEKKVGSQSDPFRGLPFLPAGVTIMGAYHTHPHKPGNVGDLFASVTDRNYMDSQLYRAAFPSILLRFLFVGDGRRGYLSYWMAGSGGNRGSTNWLKQWDSFGKGGQPKPLP